DWSSDVCSSDLCRAGHGIHIGAIAVERERLPVRPGISRPPNAFDGHIQYNAFPRCQKFGKTAMRERSFCRRFHLPLFGAPANETLPAIRNVFLAVHIPRASFVMLNAVDKEK